MQEALTRNAEEQRRIAEELARKTEARAEEKAYRADVKATEKAMLVSVDGNLADEVAALTGVKAKGSCAEHAIAARVTARKVVQRVPFDREAWEQGKAQKRMAKELGYQATQALKRAEDDAAAVVALIVMAFSLMMRLFAESRMDDVRELIDQGRRRGAGQAP